VVVGKQKGGAPGKDRGLKTSRGYVAAAVMWCWRAASRRWLRLLPRAPHKSATLEGAIPSAPGLCSRLLPVAYGAAPAGGRGRGSAHTTRGLPLYAPSREERMDPAGGRAFLRAIALRAPWRAGLFVVAMVSAWRWRCGRWMALRARPPGLASVLDVATHAAAPSPRCCNPARLGPRGRPLSEYGCRRRRVGAPLREGVAWVSRREPARGHPPLGASSRSRPSRAPPLAIARSGRLPSPPGVFRELAARATFSRCCPQPGILASRVAAHRLFAAESLLNAANRSVLAWPTWSPRRCSPAWACGSRAACGSRPDSARLPAGARLPVRVRALLHPIPHPVPFIPPLCRGVVDHGGPDGPEGVR